MIVIVGLRRSGFGRMLYAYGDNPMAMRLAGVRSWQLLTVTYAYLEKGVVTQAIGFFYNTETFKKNG